MKELVEIGGVGFIIPAVLSVVMLYAIRGLFGMHGRRSQSRKEFLELWDEKRARDDLWLETSIRHLIGTYLPAHVIRLALSCPDKAQSLFDLSDLWPLLCYDRKTRTVTWLHARHRHPGKRRQGRFLLYLGYFACATSAFLVANAAANSGPRTFSGWVFGILAILLGVIAIFILMREETIKVANAVGDEWIHRINASVVPEGKHVRDGMPDSDAAPR